MSLTPFLQKMTPKIIKQFRKINYFQVDNELKTLPEEFGNPRSDCHGWGAHLLYQHFASVMGMRPDVPEGKISPHRKLDIGKF